MVEIKYSQWRIFVTYIVSSFVQFVVKFIAWRY
jgi:hypothetical protein